MLLLSPPSLWSLSRPASRVPTPVLYKPGSLAGRRRGARRRVQIHHDVLIVTFASPLGEGLKARTPQEKRGSSRQGKTQEDTRATLGRICVCGRRELGVVVGVSSIYHLLVVPFGEERW